MFDIGFSELMVIGVVSLIVVGPKDLPNMFRTVGKYVGKAKGMAREFQRSMEDAADASGFSDIQKDLKGVTKGLEDVNKFSNPGFSTAKAAKDQFNKIVDAKDSGTPLEESESAPAVAAAGPPQKETPDQPPKVVEIVEEPAPDASPESEPAAQKD